LEKQIAILDASARIFAQKGYFQAGINEIRQAAFISNGALCKEPTPGGGGFGITPKRG
jgi:hypothetical protein